jgi:alcohol dehydrogenase class IV
MSNIFYITQVQIDFGIISLLSEECTKYGITKPLIITDQGIKKAGILDKALQVLAPMVVSVFDETPSNPTEAAVVQAARICKDKGCDGIIALGGGSSIDCAKGVAILATHPGELKNYATIEGGSARISDKVLPLIAVPTTAGTGSEVARGAILIVQDGRKLGFHSWHLVPKVALLDPELTLGLPPLLTAATGMDAIAHCMETFMAPPFNPPADGIALEGLTRGWANIERATINGNDHEARKNMMCASMMGAMAFQKGLGCVHSLSHSLGGVNPKLHHGTLNAVFLPSVIEFNSSADSIRKENRLLRMAHAIGLSPADEQEALKAIKNALKEMSSNLGLPNGLRQMGVEEVMFEKIIDGAVADHCHKTNPRIATRSDYAQMLLESM